MSKSVVFYGKPTCVNNRKQVRLLVQAGVDVAQRNIFEVQWSTSRLSRFFNGVPLLDCVNPSAPLVKSKEIDVENLSRFALLQMMCLSPVLIRRPLIVYEDRYWVGFNWKQLCAEMGLNFIEPTGNNIETCAKER